MCHINIIYAKTKHNKKYNELLNVLTFHSYTKNSDGDGFLLVDINNNTTTLKSRNKIIFDTDALKFKLIATHQRMATSGLKDEYIHPHESNDLILIHNGVLSGLTDGEKSDTRIYTENLQTEYNKTNDLIQAIKNVNLNVSGSYSILVFNKRNNKAYYFKENSTNMFLIENDHVLIATTSKENAEYARVFLNIENNIKEIEPLKIFDVFDGFKEIDTFTEKKTTFSYYGDASFKWFSSKKSNSKKSTRRNIVKMLKDVFNATLSNYDDDFFNVVVPTGDLNTIFEYFEHVDVVRTCRNSTIVKLKYEELLTALNQFKEPLNVNEYLNNTFYNSSYNRDYEKPYKRDLYDYYF